LQYIRVPLLEALQCADQFLDCLWSREVGTKIIATYMLLKQSSDELTAFLMIVLLVMSAADLSKMAVTMARLSVVCSRSFTAAPLAAPLTAMMALS